MAAKPVKVLADLQTRKQILKLDSDNNILFRVSGSFGDGVVTIELPVTASDGITARLYGTASYALNAATASYVENGGGIASVYTSGSITGSGTELNPVFLKDPLVIGTISASHFYSPEIFGTLYGTSSYAFTASYAENAGGALVSVYTSGSITGSGLEQNPIKLTDPLIIGTLTSSYIYSQQITGNLHGTASFATTAEYAQNVTNVANIEQAYKRMRYQEIGYFNTAGEATIVLPTSSYGGASFTTNSFNYINVSVYIKEDGRWLNDLLSVQLFTASNNIFIELSAPSLNETNQYKLLAVNEDPDYYII
jgi:hypothetical protein